MTYTDYFAALHSLEPDYLVTVNSIPPQKFGKVAVLYGGTGSEREVSLMSGQAVYQALQQKGIHAELVDTQFQPIEKLITGKYDRAFNILHGAIGEDGTIAALLNLLNIPCTGANVLASALAMDKPRSKWIWQALGLPTIPFGVANTWPEAKRIAAQLNYPLVIKPVNQGSSVGVQVNLKNEVEFQISCEATLETYGQALIEPYIVGEDYMVGIVGSRVLPSVRLVTQEPFNNYKAKYQATTNQYFSPGTTNEALEQKCAEIAWKAYQALGCTGWGRIDLLVDKKDQVWLLELNTAPGLTPTSFIPKGAKAAGYDFATFVTAILSATLYQTEAQKSALGLKTESL